MSYTLTDLPSRVSSRVEVTETGCWEWQGWRNGAGYGYLRVDGRDRCAHRVTYEALAGAIPPGLELDHLCTNPPCVNPGHLEPVTHQENQRRVGQRQTACQREGHDWTDPLNVRRRPDGRRYCAECDRKSCRDRYQAKRRGAK
ncbi:HNH endonuclease signature motif containing protein [Streptomyces hydrogenans]|uniref:HNH nuclease domain-containing protein n=1 Tax=Streptomyces hydrogenans TaxID=1873719 RepID=A0ABQ3PJJ7_9ACTN|nr:HNH endonuclease signature motif containing protein [Streptomyces hydrogenans]GHG10148.1 hypothetical protein GCM10018784_23560 [Streptomyces hydrogenans]GHI25192.1 hypothetical protein Shyd_65630 [Streptomyces hydrogenans]